MRQKLIYTLVLLVSLIFGACGSKVNQKELDKKIENMDINNMTFTDNEYEFMADYLSKHLDDEPANNEDANYGNEQIGSYYMVLTMADQNGKLKGKTKEQYEKFAKKVNSLLQDAHKEAERAMEESMSEYDDGSDYSSWDDDNY